MVSDRGRYCNRGVLSFRRILVNFPVAGSLESSHIPAHLRQVRKVFIKIQKLQVAHERRRKLHEARQHGFAHVCLQCQTWRPEHLDARQQKFAKIQDIVMSEQHVYVHKGLAVAQYRVDGAQCLLLLGGEMLKGPNRLEGGVLVCNNGHVLILAASSRGPVDRCLGDRRWKVAVRDE